MISPEFIYELIANIVDRKKQQKRDKPRIGSQFLSNGGDDVHHLPEYYGGYALSVKWLEQIRIHAQKGVYPYALFSKQAPNQTPAEAEYVRANYKQTTIQVFKDMVDTYGRAYHENNWSIQFTPDADQYVNDNTTLQQYLDSSFPEYGSLDNFVFTFLPPLKMMDAMGVVAVMPYEIPVIEKDGEQIIDPDSLVEPYTKFYHTTRVVAYDEEFAVIESEERSIVDYNGKEVHDGMVYLIFDDQWIYKAVQVGKKVDYTFEVMEWFNHATGIVPVKRVDGIAIQIDETMMQQSPFLYATDILDEVLLDSALLRGIKPTCTYPFRVMVGEYCEFSIRDNGEQLVCDNGYHYRADGSKSICPECNGTGAKDRISPYGTLLIKPQKGANNGDTVSPDRAIYYASPSVETPNFLRQEIASGMATAYDILHLKKTDNKVQGSLTATEVASDQKSLIAGIKQNCIQLFDMYEWCIDVIGLMRYGANYRKPIIKRPVNYDFYLEADYMAQINEAITSKQPPFVIQSIIYKYLQTLYYPDVQGQKVFNLISQADRLLTMTSEEINLKQAKGLVNNWEVVLHDSAINFVNALMMDNPDFFEQDFNLQLEQLINKAKEVSGGIGAMGVVAPFSSEAIINDIVSNTTIDAVEKTPELLKDMTANERRELLLDLPAQMDKASEERLLVEVLGVGGTQALQSIVTDVNLTPTQKINLLVEVFGFTKEVANRIIG